MKRYSIFNRDCSVCYSADHTSIDSAKDTLIYAIRNLDPFAHMVEHEDEITKEKLQKLLEVFLVTKVSQGAAIADLYKAADCKTCGYQGSGCRAKTHEDEIDHSCYKWRGEMEFLNERRTDDD